MTFFGRSDSLAGSKRKSPRRKRIIGAGIETLESRLLLTGTFLDGLVQGYVPASPMNEVSGIVASRSNPGVLWAHNDSGDTNKVYAINEQAQLLGEFVLSGASATDYEDIAVGPGNNLFVADIGDNGESRGNIKVYRVPEPTVAANGGDQSQALSNVDTLTLTYPDGPHNAETLLIDPASGDLYIVTKSSSENNSIYWAAAPAAGDQTIVLEHKGDMNWPTAVGGDVSSDGREILIKSRTTVYLYDRDPATEDIWEALLSAANVTNPPYTEEFQGEAIAFDSSAEHYYTLSEAPNSSSDQPLLLYERVNPSSTNTPTASDDAASTDANTPLVIAVATLLGNDDDQDGDPISIVGINQPANGSVVDNQDGTLTYTPNTGFDGTDGFTYTLSDGTGGRDTANVSITVLPEPITNTFAISETTIDGNVITNDLEATKNSDNVYEAIQERHSGGKPANRINYLEHYWTFNVPIGQAVRFSVAAHHDSSGDGDDFAFEYSADGANFTSILTVTKTLDDDIVQTVDLPSSLSGTVFIRVIDTDRSTTGRGNLDTVYIDELFIQTVNSGPILPLVSLQATDASAAEPSDDGVFTFTRSGDTTAALDIVYSIAGSATNGADYNVGSPLTGIVTIPAGLPSATVRITPFDDTADEGTEDIVLALVADAAYQIGASHAAIVEITDDDGTSTTISDYALMESTRFGTADGDYVNTHVNDGASETITEDLYAGNKRSRMEHTWTFDVSGGRSVTFNLNAQTLGAESFVFEHSTDGVNWTTITSIDSSSPTDLQTYSIDSGISGTVFVRVRDTNRSRGDSTADSISIDEMYFESESL